MAFDIGPRIGIEGEKEFRASIQAINQNLKTLKSEMEAATSQFDKNDKSQEALTARSGVLTKQIEEQRKKLEALQSGLAQAAAKYGENDKVTQGWQQSVNKATAELNNMERELSSNNDALRDVARGYNEAGQKLDEFGNVAKDNANAIDTMSAALAAAGVAATLKEITNAIQECAKASIEFESAIAGVSKTVDGTPEQLQAISDGIKQMSTEIPTTTTEISAVAEAAGQLGIATEDVLSFTRTMLDLGQSTNLSAEEAAVSLAKFANITGTSAENYDRIGSSIVALGNNMATTERDIVAMSTRLASAGTLAGLTETEILALSAAMSSVGIDAEAGGTAMTQTLAAMQKAVATGGDDLDKFAKIAGMSAESFAQTWSNAPMEAIIAFVAGLGGLKDQGESAVLALDDMGLSGVRQSNMLQSLALASEKLTGAVDLSNRAWEENSALSEEASKRYATTESRLQMAANAANNLMIAIGDALTPALGNLADVGTEAFSWAAKFVEENPWLVQAITSLVAALAVLLAAFAGFTVLQKIIPLIKAFNLALAENPAGAVAVAIIALVAALGTFIAAQSSAKDETQQLVERLKEQKKAHEELKATIEEESTNTDNLVSSLESMLDVENKSEIQKLAILKRVEELNAAIPGLALSYDAATDSINMTADALAAAADKAESQKNAEADAKTLSDAYSNQADIADQLKEAKLRLYDAEEAAKKATDDAAASTDNGAYVMGGYYDAVDVAATAVQLAKRDVETLTATQEENDETIKRLSVDTETNTEAQKKNQSQTVDLAAELKNQEDAYKKLEAASSTLTDAQDNLTSALKEQKDAGTVNLKTAMDLIDAGYASALSIDTETGAITLNKDAYIQIAKAKADEQLAAIETQRISLQTAIRIKEEAISAANAGISYISLATAKILAEKASDGSLESAKKELASLDAQSAAITKLKSDLSNYSFAAASAASSRSSTAKKEKTQAEKDLAEYKELRATLDHERAMGEVEEEAYYKRLIELRDKYLTNTANLDENRRVTEEYYKHQKDIADSAYKQAKADLDYEHSTGVKSDAEYYEELLRLKDQYLTDASDDSERRRIDEAYYKYRTELAKKETDEQLKIIQDGAKEIEEQAKGIVEAATGRLSELQKNIEDVEKSQNDFAEKLSGSGGLFENVKGQFRDFFVVRDLDKDTKQIEEYGNALEKLKDRAIPKELLNEIKSMSMEDGLQYANNLLGMTDKTYDAYIESWQKKQEAAKKVAETFYSDELDTLKTEFADKIPEELDSLKSQLTTLGEEAAKGLGDGFASQADYIAQKFNETINSAMGDVANQFSGIAEKAGMNIVFPATTGGMYSQPQAQATTQAANQSTATNVIVTDVTLEMDGSVLARKMYTYDQREDQLHGSSLVEGK